MAKNPLKKRHAVHQNAVVKMAPRIVKDRTSLEEISELLRINKLPHQDLQFENSLFITCNDDTNVLVGAGGLELYGGYALLRSVVVDVNYRRSSYGSTIITYLLAQAKGKGVKEVYLLTETAREFFLKHGFEDIPRDKVPPEIQATSEYSSVCPVSASVMLKKVL